MKKKNIDLKAISEKFFDEHKNEIVLNSKNVIDKYADKWVDENCFCYDKSSENLARAAYIAGSDTMLDLICKWLENNATKYDATTDTFHSTVDIKALRRYLNKGV